MVSYMPGDDSETLLTLEEITTFKIFIYICILIYMNIYTNTVFLQCTIYCLPHVF